MEHKEQQTRIKLKKKKRGLGVMQKNKKLVKRYNKIEIARRKRRDMKKFTVIKWIKLSMVGENYIFNTEKKC